MSHSISLLKALSRRRIDDGWQYRYCHPFSVARAIDIREGDDLAEAALKDLARATGDFNATGGKKKGTNMRKLNSL